MVLPVGVEDNQKLVAVEKRRRPSRIAVRFSWLITSHWRAECARLTSTLLGNIPLKKRAASAEHDEWSSLP